MRHVLYHMFSIIHFIVWINEEKCVLQLSTFIEKYVLIIISLLRAPIFLLC
jgi:hypothetical protein